jgi:hypothetical protein
MANERPDYRKGFEALGREQLRLRIEHRPNEYAGEIGREAERWLHEQDAKAAAIEHSRFRTIRFWAVIGGVTGALAAIAAWIAAWPVIAGWIWKH